MGHLGNEIIRDAAEIEKIVNKAAYENNKEYHQSYYKKNAERLKKASNDRYHGLDPVAKQKLFDSINKNDRIKTLMKGLKREFNIDDIPGF